MKGGGFIRDFLVEKENIYSMLFIYTPLYHTSHTQKIIFDQLSIIQTWNATGSRVYTEIY